jgi:hypothetical protein
MLSTKAERVERERARLLADLEYIRDRLTRRDLVLSDRAGWEDAQRRVSAKLTRSTN